MSVFSERLKAKRKERGIVQIETAKRLGVAQSTYVYYEQRGREPDLEILGVIANILQTTTDYLIGRTEE